MKEINLTSREAIAEFFGDENFVSMLEPAKIIYINEVGVETAFKVQEGSVVTKEQILISDQQFNNKIIEVPTTEIEETPKVEEIIEKKTEVEDGLNSGEKVDSAPELTFPGEGEE